MNFILISDLYIYDFAKTWLGMGTGSAFIFKTGSCKFCQHAPTFSLAASAPSPSSLPALSQSSAKFLLEF